jgi:hypothetical protein
LKKKEKARNLFKSLRSEGVKKKLLSVLPVASKVNFIESHGVCSLAISLK